MKFIHYIIQQTNNFFIKKYVIIQKNKMNTSDYTQEMVQNGQLNQISFNDSSDSSRGSQTYVQISIQQKKKQYFDSMSSMSGLTILSFKREDSNYVPKNDSSSIQIQVIKEATNEQDSSKFSEKQQQLMFLSHIGSSQSSNEVNKPVIINWESSSFQSLNQKQQDENKKLKEQSYEKVLKSLNNSNQKDKIQQKSIISVNSSYEKDLSRQANKQNQFHGRKLQQILQKATDQNLQEKKYDPNQFNSIKYANKNGRDYELLNQIAKIQFQDALVKQNSQTVQRIFEIDPQQHYENVTKCGLQCLQNGKYDISISLLKKKLQFVESKQGTIFHQKYIQGLYHVCMVYIRSCNYNKGYDLSLKNKQNAIKLLGENHKTYANILHYYGLAVGYMGNNNSAINIFNRVVQIKLSLGDMESLENVFNDLAFSYCDVKNFQQALAMSREVRKTMNQKSKFKDLQKKILKNIQSNKNLTPQQIEKYRIQECIKQGVFFCLLGRIYRCKQDYNQSLQSQLKCLEFVKKGNGKDHLYVSIPLKHIGQIYLIQKQYQKAKKFLLKSDKIIQRSIGKDNAKYAINLINIGRLHFQCNQFEKAIQTLQKCREKLNIYLDKDNFFKGATLFYLGKAYKAIKQNQKAYECLSECLRIRQVNYGVLDQDYLKTQKELNQLKQILEFNS